MSLRDTNIHCFDKCQKLETWFKLVKQFMLKPSIQASANEHNVLQVSFLSIYVLFLCLDVCHQNPKHTSRHHP